MTMIVYAFFSFGINEAFGEVTAADRIKNILIVGIAVVIAFFMLWHRLPDSINSSILRSCHDFYVDNKKKKLPKLLMKQQGKVEYSTVGAISFGV